jgi:predicted nucleotidyltransferase
VLEADPRIAYAVLFGSTVRRALHANSDLDIAIGTAGSVDTLALGEWTARPYRIFRDGVPLVIRDRSAYCARLARAILEYLDFKPVEDLFTQAVLRARRG